MNTKVPSVFRNRPLRAALLLIVMVLVLAQAGLAGEVFWTEAPQTGRKAMITPAPAESFAPLAESVMPAVVTVYIKKKARNPLFFFQSYEQEGSGSGFIVTSDGYIITNNHVVEGSDSIKVAVGVKQKKEYKAKLIGADPEIDIALIKIDEKDLPVLPLGDSDALRVGDWVAAIGSPFGFPHTFTVGVVSAKGRRLGIGNYDDFIQTDASINAGNSGGPMVNIYGEVVGVNSLIFITSPYGGNVGIGFSIPINLVKTVLPQLKESGKVTRSWLGVSIESVTDDLAQQAGLDRPRGAHVVQVVVGGPADKAGIEVGDIITEFNGQTIEDSRDLPTMVSSFGVGREADITFLHNGKSVTSKIVLDKLPDPKEMAKREVRGGVNADNPLGVAVRDLTDDDVKRLSLSSTQGALVVSVTDDGPGAQNGIKTDDVIVKINLSDVKSAEDFERAVKGLNSGSYVRISIKRGGGNVMRVFKLP